MNEGDKKKVVHIHQSDMDNFSKDVMAAVLDLMVDQDKFTTVGKLLAVYGACLEIAYEIDVGIYRDLVERVIAANEDIIKNIHEGYALADQSNTGKTEIPSPKRFWAQISD